MAQIWNLGGPAPLWDSRVFMYEVSLLRSLHYCYVEEGVACIKNRKQDLKEILVDLRSRQCYSQQLKRRSDPSVHWQMSGHAKCGFYMQEDKI